MKTSRYLRLGFVGLGLSGMLAGSVWANGNVHVTRFWHNHQPLYWPEWNSNGSETERGQYAWDSIVLKPGQNYGGLSPKQHPENNLTDIFGLDDRRNAYQFRPRDSLSTFSGGGFALSYSGSLIDNVRQLGGVGQLGYGGNWADGNREARGWGRLDLVGFTYHHSLAPLLPKEVFRKELQIFKQAWWKAWNGNSDLSDHSKGFFPTEMAYSRHLIDVLTDEGYEWVIVASHHISRTSPSYNDVADPEGSYQIFSSPPNRADQLSPTFNDGWWYGQPNPGNAAWNVAPFAYQLHKVQYVNPTNGAIKEMIAVPSDDVLSYRFGYANEGISKIQSHIAPFANDPNRPVIVMPASDGDNAWGGGFSSWMEATPQYFNDSANAGYNKSMPGAFVNAHKANAPVTHIEDGAWIFPESDYGSPYFLKWIEPPLGAKGAPGNYPGTFADLETPGFALKFFSYAPLMAGANYVITAEQIWKDNGGEVRPWVIQAPYDWDGQGYGDRNDVEKAWHIYLKGLDSGFNYYGGLGNDDEAKPGLATKRATDLLQSYISANIADDRTAPTVLKPQRFPYNPGWYTFGWFNSFGTGTNAAFLKRMPSEFYVWTHAFDVSGINSVNLKVRIDNDGVNSMATTDNETYAGGSDVGGWVTLPMNMRSLPKTRSALNALAANGDIDYFVFDPSFWPDPKVADYYFAKITDNNVPGFRGKLLDYYVEATDSRGNVHKSEIQHVWVENDGGTSSDPSTATFSSDPRDCAPLTVTYSANQGPLSNSVPVKLWISFNEGGFYSSYTMTNQGGGVHAYTVSPVPDNAPSATVYFQNGAETITDNRNGLNWSATIRDCDAPDGPSTATFSNAPACEPVTVEYRPNGHPLQSATQVYAHVGFDTWATVIPNQPMTKVTNNLWRIVLQPQTNAAKLDLVFNNGSGTWDNNSGNDWHFDLNVCVGEPPVEGFVITNPPADTAVGFAVASYTLRGVGDNVTGELRWTNSLTGQSGGAFAGQTWSIANIPLGVGDNVITVTGTNLPAGVATNAADSSGAYGAAWADGSNLGTGFGAWALESVGSAGHFVNGTGWGLWSHEPTNYSAAVRNFAAPLAAGQTFHVRMKNGWIWEGGGSVGVALRDTTGGEKWLLYFNGGATNYTGTDGVTDIGWTDGGLDIAFTLTGATNYSVDITPVAGGATRTYTGSFAGTIDNLRAWSYSNGTDDEFNSNRDYFINNLAITSPGGGSGSVTSDTVTITRAADTGADTDGDGIPDGFEILHGGCATCLVASADTDLDGTTDLEEYIADTIPTNAASVYNHRIVYAAGAPAIVLQAGPPTSPERRYGVQWSDNLLGSNWFEGSFDLPGNPDRSAVLITVTNPAPTRFYRTGVRVP